MIGKTTGNTRVSSYSFSFVLFLLVFFAVACRTSGDMPKAGSPALQRAALDQETANATGAALRPLVASGKLDSLRWPNYRDVSSDVAKFYEGRSYTPAWVDGAGPTMQAKAVVSILQKAAQKGLNPEDYDASKWQGREDFLAGTPTAEGIARFDLAVSVCLLRYISAMNVGRINPQHLKFDFDLNHRKIGLPEFLAQISQATDIVPLLGEVEPNEDGYSRSIQALQTYLALAQHDPAEKLPVPEKPVSAGGTYPGMALLVTKLKLVGDLPHSAAVPDGSAKYEGDVVEAVKRFQIRHALAVTGSLGPETVRQLNVPIADRLRQLQLTLERWRWLPHEIATPLIAVNVPAFRLYGFDEPHHIALKMDVIVGKAMRSETPAFIGNMTYLVFRPDWGVPSTIMRKEILPPLQKDPAYLSKNGYDLYDASGKVAASGDVTAEQIQLLRAGKLSVRQRPGPKNALGSVKFMFPNTYLVYLHDTPKTELFSQSRRDFSYGCIRVQDPPALAAWVLQSKPEWTPERIQAAMNGEKSVQVNLSSPIPVLILYGTARVDEEGRVDFYDDIYGHDAKLAQALAKGYPYPQ
ncbi:MAG TPA: L,D-transpeptidase family protein [Candidatus Sulfotelmatobacter sp.]|nr:L,D-transpeptidase family protein [Candidatus Sulfotelmatobacter sp.]